MATESQLIEALRRADAAGNTADAQMIANELKKVRQPKMPTNVGTMIAQGASFGFADEIGSGLGAATVGTGKGVINAVKAGDLRAIPQAIGKEFVELQDYQRRGREEFRKERPVTATVSEVAGGLATGGVGLLKGGLKAAIGTGAIQGGLYGAGATTGGIEERAKGAALGAGIGAAAGGTFYKAAQFFNARRAGVRVSDDVKRSYDTLREVLEYDLGSRGKAEAALRVWMKNGASPDELLDLAGPSLQNLQREIASQRPTSAVEFVSRIRSEATEDIRGVVAGSISKNDQSVRASRAALKIAREAQASRLYERAYAEEIPRALYYEKIHPLLQSDSARKSISMGLKLVDAQLDEPTKAMLLKARRGDRVVLSVKALDQIKKGFDDQIGGHLRAGNNQIAKALIEAKNGLVNAIDSVNPYYSEARNIWAGSMAADEALDLGKSFVNPSYTADDLVSDMASMTNSEKEFLRVGVAEQLENTLDRIKDGANAGRRFADESFRKKIRVLFDDPSDAQAFIDIVKKAEERSIKAQRIDPFSGSQTELRHRAKEAFEKASQGRIEQGADLIADGLGSIPKKAAKAASRASRSARGGRVSDILEEVFFGAGGQSLTPPPAQQVQIPYRAGPQANIILQNTQDRNQ